MKKLGVLIGAPGFAVLLAAVLGGCRSGPAPVEETKKERKEVEVVAFVLESTAFTEGARMPDKHTCTGADVSPPLRWRDVPAGTQSFALIVEDPDAPGGTFVHWVLYDLPTTVTELPEGVPRQERLDNGALQGRNDFGTIGYRGPCPPPGRPHRYFFVLRALDTPTLNLSPGATQAQVEQALQEHVLGEARLMGTYSR